MQTAPHLVTQESEKRKTKREFLAHYTLDGNILDRCRKGNGETELGITTFSLSIRMTSVDEIWSVVYLGVCPR